MNNGAEKPAKSGDDLSVGSMEQQTVTERPVIKRKQRQPQKEAPKAQSLLIQTQMTQAMRKKTKNLW